jgi:hypothetical protein
MDHKQLRVVVAVCKIENNFLARIVTPLPDAALQVVLFQ